MAQHLLEPREANVPEALVLAQPLVRFRERLRIEAAEMRPAAHRSPDEPSALERLHVLRCGGERHAVGLGELTHGMLALRELLEHAASRAVPEGAEDEISRLLSEWERWSAELLESHISYTLLCYYRSQHTNQSWVGALTAILDTSALLIAGVRGHEARQAQLTFAMARHALVDLAQVFSLTPAQNMPDRLPPEKYEQLYTLLCQSGVSVCRDGQSYERLRNLRALYEGYATSLSDHLSMPLPPWIAEQPHKDNWLAVAKVRREAESATSAIEPHNLAEVIDQHHEF